MSSLINHLSSTYAFLVLITILLIFLFFFFFCFFFFLLLLFSFFICLPTTHYNREYMYSSKDTSSPSSLGENMEIILSPMMTGRTNSSPHTILISKQVVIYFCFSLTFWTGNSTCIKEYCRSGLRNLSRTN